MLKKIIISIVILAATAAAIAAYEWHKPHTKVEDKKGIAITATSMAKEYTADEKAADARYLNKAIEVSGTVSEVDKNQDGGAMIVLATSDPTAGIQCTMRDKNAAAAKGDNVKIKGFCSGNGITGVSLTDCIIEH